MGYELNLVDKEKQEAVLLENADCECEVSGAGVVASAHATYNYSKHYYRVFSSEHGLYALSGLTGEQSVPVLQNAVKQLADDETCDPWQATEGNAKRALLNFLALANEFPKAVWEVF